VAIGESKIWTLEIKMERFALVSVLAWMCLMPHVTEAVVTSFDSNLLLQSDFYNDECLWFKATVDDATAARFEYNITAMGIDWRTNANSHTSMVGVHADSACIPLKSLFTAGTTTDIRMTRWVLRLFDAADAVLVTYTNDLTKFATSTYTGPYYHAGTSTIKHKAYMSSTSPQLSLVFATSAAALFVSTSSAATSTFPFTYHDWIFVMGMVIFLLSFPVLGFFFSLWERNPRRNS